VDPWWGMFGSPPLDLRRRTRPPAAGLLRFTAVVAALTLPLVVGLSIWKPFGPEPCGGTLDANGFPVPCTEVINPFDVIFRATVAAGCIELVAIGIYLAVTLPRTTATPGAVLRWLPVSASVVALALGGFSVVSRGGALAWFLWLIAPLIFYGVHRADPTAVVPVLLGLLPSAVVSAILVIDSAFNGLPAAIFLTTGIFVGLQRVRRRR